MSDSNLDYAEKWIEGNTILKKELEDKAYNIVVEEFKESGYGGISDVAIVYQDLLVEEFEEAMELEDKKDNGC